MEERLELEKERKLIEKAQQDPEHFLELYDKYYEKIFRYVVRRVSIREDAEDIVHQTFHNALSALPRFQWKGFPFSSWLFRIAHNNVIKWYRKNRKYVKVTLDEARQVGDGGITVERMADQKISQKVVENLLGKLKKDEQEIIRLKFFEHATNIEIAEIMGLSVTNVGVRIFRTLKKAKNLLPENFTFE